MLAAALRQPRFSWNKGREGKKMNNSDREQWIDNDEGLYNWWRSSRLPKRQFIRDNKVEIDAAIENVTCNRKPAHYLAYGG